MSYPTEKLGKYIDILSGFAFKSKDFSNTGVPVIKIKNITPPYVSLEDVTYVPNDIATQQKKFQVHYGDILIALTGSHINQMASVVGRIAKVNFFDKALLNQRVGKIYIVDDTSCNLDYVYYFLSQGKVKIELASKAGGAANQANISPTDVKNLQIPFPSKAIQDRIADILLAYDNLIENNQKQIKLLEEAARRLYKEWFVDLRFPGYETTPVVDGVPEGWAKVEVGDCIAKVARTKQVMTAELLEVGKIPVVDQSRNFIAGYTNDEETIVDFGIPIIVFGDHTRVLKYIPFPFAKGADGTQLIVTSNERMPQPLLYCSLVNVDLSNYHYARHFKYLKAEEILLPSLRVADRFDGVVTPLFKQVQMLRDKCKLAAEARDRLLPKLMSGEIEV